MVGGSSPLVSKFCKMIKQKNSISSRLINIKPVDMLINHVAYYPTNASLNYFWSFGSLAGIVLVIQIVTGLLLSMHYVPNILHAFDSVEHIMRDVNNGWLLRYTHANGASFFFIVVYLHMARGIFYKSYILKPYVWLTGMIIFVLLMGTAFIGYVLPWGQMSFWGATVITNLVTAVPFVGTHIATWVWGGFSVENPTLNRFFVFHFILPFIVAVVSVLHIYLLHEVGSSNPVNLDCSADKITFHPYYTVKDVFGLLIFLFSFFWVIFYEPNMLAHSDNYIPANPLVTPAHIVPEWYFLPFYAILRSCPDKIGGIISMGGAIVLLGLLRWIDTSKFVTSVIDWRHQIWFSFFAANLVVLGWLGGQPAEEPFISIAKFSSFSYLLLFVVLFFLSQNGKSLSRTR